jgi:hypothetical protein
MAALVVEMPFQGRKIVCNICLKFCALLVTNINKKKEREREKEKRGIVAKTCK